MAKKDIQIPMYVPLILKMCDIVFSVFGQLHSGTFLGIFRGGLYLFDPYIALSAQDNFGIKMFWPSSNYLKCPII